MSEKSFAHLLKELRKNLRMTQKDFAEKVGIAHKTLQNYEAGLFLPKIDRQKSIIELAKTLKPESIYNLNQNITQSNNNNSGSDISTELQRCKEQIEELKARLKDKEEIIALLKKKE